MRSRSRYLAWAAERYGQVPFDLATSGMAPPPPDTLGAFSAEALVDPNSWHDLRRAVATYNDVPPSEAVAALGTTHALWLACEVLAEPGDDVLVEGPGYEPLARIAESVGARVLAFQRPASTGFALDPDLVARAMTTRTKLVVLTNPHNPSGVRAGLDALGAVAAAAASRGASVLVDEVYAPFDDFVDQRGVFGGSARKVAQNVICAGSLGKCYGLGAARVGWLLGPEPVIAAARDAIVTSVGALPLAHARVGVRCFERMGLLVDRARERTRGKRERVAAWVAELGLDWSAPESGLFGFVHLPGAGDLTSFVESTARERGVLVAPGAFFGLPDGFRLSWAADDDVLDEGLARLGDALRGRPARG